MQPSADDAREASLSRSHVRIHMDATDEVRTQPAQIPQPAGDQSTPLGRTALVASTSPPDDADAPRERRLASARSSAGASELDELDEVAAIIAEQPAEHHHEPSPYLTANVLSKITWRWLSPLLAAGAKKPLELEDLHALMPRDQAGVGLAGVKAAIKKVEGNLEKKAAETGSTTKQRGTSAMWTVMWHQFGRHYLTIQLLLFLYTGFKIVQPLMLIQLVQFVQNPDEVAWHGYVYGVAMGLGSLGQACVHHNYFFHVSRNRFPLRIPALLAVKQQQQQQQSN
jgi:hypothetical protein